MRKDTVLKVENIGFIWLGICEKRPCWTNNIQGHLYCSLALLKIPSIWLSDTCWTHRTFNIVHTPQHDTQSYQVRSYVFSTFIYKFLVIYNKLFILLMGFSRQEHWSSLPFPSPVDHILSKLSTMTCLFWVALHGMAHSFIELDKAVVYVIRLVSFLWLWFSVCLPSDGEG